MEHRKVDHLVGTITGLAQEKVACLRPPVLGGYTTRTWVRTRL